MYAKQGEALFADILAEMGCTVTKGNDWITVEGTDKLSATEKDMSNMPDVVQTLAAVAVFAEGNTRMTNIENLHYKESDRIEATAQELSRLGIEVTTTNNEMAIHGITNLHPAIIDPHNDHRMAMSFALLGLKVTGIKIKNPEVVSKSFPTYWDKLKELGVTIQNV